MKRLQVALISGGILVCTAAVASAGSYGTAGCGLGSLIFKDEPGMVQVLAATTNGTFGNQTFGITSGTLNCGGGMKISSNDKAAMFVAKNMDNLTKDIAQGKGESLDAFAELLNVPASEKTAFAGKLQSNFGRIFTSENIMAANVVENVNTVLAN